MTDAVSAFIDHLRAHEIGPDAGETITPDGKRRYYRIEGDKAKVLKGAYCLTVDADGFAYGWGMSFRRGDVCKWHAKSSRKASPDERAEWKRKADDARTAQDAEAQDIAARAAIKAARIWSLASTTGGNGYLTRKGLTGLNGARVWNDMIVVPMRANGKITGLQFIAANGDKRFLTGSAKMGAYHAMADKGDTLARIVIAEGYATAAQLRAALGLPVIVAFDAGNLKHVAVAIRKKNPDTEIIFAADNDQWREGNPGIHGAQQAAVAIGGARVVSPDVPADDPDKRTDWDDIARSDGPDAVKAAFDKIPSAPQEEAPTMEPEQRDNWQPDAPDDPLDVIRPLGHDRGIYSFFPKDAGQIVALSAPAMGSIQNLYKLAPRGFWDKHYSPDGKTPDSKICAFASAHLMAACHARGIFQRENTRGVGAWVDGKTALINCGDVIITSDGRRAHPAQFKGEYVYESGARCIKLDIEPASNKEAAKLLNLCKMLKFKRPQYAVLMAGWIVVSQISGALKWCPHIWFAGKAGSGKSWALNNIVVPAVGRIGIKRDGGTSEAGIRKALGISSRPFILDEAESQNNQRQIENEKILALLRGASSGSTIENAYATFQVKSCFALAAIIPRIEQVADKERITLLEMIKNDSPSADDEFAALEDAAHSLLTPDYSDALLSRTIDNIEVLLANVAIFTRAAAMEFKNKRSGDQLGPMLAGAYSLTSTKPITMIAAREWIAKQDWEWHTEGYEDSDAAKLVTYIMTSRVRYDHEGMSREATVGDLLQVANDAYNPAQKSADKALRPYGLRVIGDQLMVSNTAPGMRRLLKDTQYIPWSGTLGNFNGANNHGSCMVHFMTGMSTRVTALPLADVMGGDAVARVADVEMDI